MLSSFSPNERWFSAPSHSALPGGCSFVVQERCRKLNPAGDTELAEDLMQVILDGGGADKQPGGDVPVGQVLGDDQPGNLHLLRGKDLRGSGAARAGLLAGCAQLGLGATGEGRHAHLIEHRESAAELV